MNARSRLAYALRALAAGVAVTACADKLFRPPASASPRIQLQFTTIGAQQVSATAKTQVLVAVAAYTVNNPTSPSDSFKILAGPVTAIVTGAAQQLTLNVDLTGCLADGTRKGSQTACSLYYGVWLHDSAGFNPDTSDFTKNAYDYTLVGPLDVTPGKAPTLPAITLSTSRYAVYQFQGDESLRLGGPYTPNGFSGPIAGSVAGVTAGSPPVLFGLTAGVQNTNNCTGQSNCQPTGYNAAQLAIFQNGQWSRVSAPQGVNQFNDVAAFSPTDVYIGGSSGLYHYDGSAITQVSAVTGANVVSVGVATSTTSKYVVAGTQAGSTWIGNTSTWQQYPMPANSSTIDGVCITGANEAFASSSANGGLYRFNGTTWTSVPSSYPQAKGDLQCTGPGQAFVWAQFTAILSWNGSGWTALPNTPRPVRIAAVSPTEIYAAGDSGSTNRVFYRFNGSSWQVVATTQFQQPMSYRPWADPRGGAAYFGSSFGRVEMATAAGAYPVSYSPSIRDAIMTSATSAFAVGWNMFLARWNGTTWTIDPPPAGTVEVRILNGVWSDGPSNAWTVGNAGTILHWDGSRWSTLSDFSHPVAQPTDSYNAVWGSGGNVWIAGAGSILHCRALTSCTNDPVTGIDSLFSIWGTSTTNAWAVGRNGKILHFDGTQWTPVTSGTSHRMVRVWGSGPSDVWAVGDSVLLHYDGSAWSTGPDAVDLIGNNASLQFSGGSFQLGMWGTGPKEVYVGTWYGNIYRFDGLSWNQMPSPQQQNGGGRVVAITGYTGGCAIALIDGQSGGYTPTLLRGVGPTGCLSSPMPVTTPWP